MREIKFRSWSGKRFYYWGLKDGGFISPPYKNEKVILDVQQFTGALDKHEDFIYEGDILEISGGRAIGVVVWRNTGFTFEFIKDTFTNYTSSKIMSEYHPNKNIEIVGNIYENKELLTQND